MSNIWPYLAALIPSIGVGVLFFFIVKNMLEGDRRERLAHSQWEAEQRRKSESDKAEDGNS